MIPCLSKISFKQWKRNTEKWKHNMEIFWMSCTLCIPSTYVEYLDGSTTLNQHLEALLRQILSSEIEDHVLSI